MTKPRRPSRMRGLQRGTTLVELQAGLASGLLVVAVAMGALMLARGISATIGDASGIQQQAAYLMRVLGLQLRQAGSLYLNPDAAGGAGTDVLGAVVFETRAQAHGGGNGFEPKDRLVGGAHAVAIGYRRYPEQVFLAGNAADSATGSDFLMRNCIGGPGNRRANGKPNTDARIESIFSFADGRLLCAGNGAAPQPIAHNLAQFELAYLVQTTAGGTGAKLQYRKGSDMPHSDPDDPVWRQVQGVQVCLVLHGSEPIDMPAGSGYIDCGGRHVDITGLADPGRKNRMHLLFRNTFQLRSQGLP